MLIGALIENQCKDSVAEHLLCAVRSLTKENEAARNICMMPELQFRTILEFIINNAEGREEANVS